MKPDIENPTSQYVFSELNSINKHLEQLSLKMPNAIVQSSNDTVLKSVRNSYKPKVLIQSVKINALDVLDDNGARSRAALNMKNIHRNESTRRLLVNQGIVQEASQ